MTALTRRAAIGALGVTPVVYGQTKTAAAPWLPQQDPALVREMVSVAHSDVKRVRELAEAHPALSNAAWDWGFGDWEDALGGASHTGQRAIAEVLLAHGARPSIFSAAMLGQLDVVKALVTASPGIQRTHGPHSITLLAHARAGGKDAEPVLRYLEAVGDADIATPKQPLENKDRDGCVGRYRFGLSDSEVFDVDVRNDRLGITRVGGTRRPLTHVGNLVFCPSGAPFVKIAFAAGQLTIADPDVYLTAKREL